MSKGKLAPVWLRASTQAAPFDTLQLEPFHCAHFVQRFHGVLFAEDRSAEDVVLAFEAEGDNVLDSDTGMHFGRRVRAVMPMWGIKRGYYARKTRAAKKARKERQQRGWG